MNQPESAGSVSRMPTKFLPAERASEGSIQEDFGTVTSAPMFEQTLNMVPTGALVLNPERQIVFCNAAFLRMLSATDIREVLGLRFGEAVKCLHSDEEIGGCGTSIFCRECGAAKAIARLKTDGSAVDECRISLKNNEALDLRVWTAQFELQDKVYTSFAVSDTSNENRRRALERIFFHDVLNTASGLRGLTELFADVPAEQKAEVQEMIQGLSNRLIDEINSQRELAAAESGEIVPKIVPVDSRSILEEMVAGYCHHDVAKGKRLQVDSNAVRTVINTDISLLRRVIGNMTKNALEACVPGDAVTVGCGLKDGQIEFWVHNPSVIPETIQLQLFQRSFSTKGAGRGLGTYSMRLLTEKYLKGKVSFASKKGTGTRFSSILPLA